MSPREQAQCDVVRPVVTGTPRGARRAEFEFLRGMIDGMRCGVLCADVERRLVMLNEHARRILDLPQGPATGPLRTVLGRYPRLVQVLSASFDMPSLPNRAEMELGSGGRRAKSIGFTMSLIRRADGTATGVAMFFKDLTPIEHKAEQERLKDRLAALGQMAASLAHEIRNPLASIEVACKLLERRIGGDRSCHDLLKKITAEVGRLNRSVDSCLQYVRPVSLNLREAELVPLVEDAIRVAEGRRGKPGIVIHRRFAHDIPRFRMDPSLLRQVFVNLILNALEAVGESGEVVVEARRIEIPGEASVPYLPGRAGDDPWGQVRQFAVVRIEDSGRGITAELRDRIFTPFFTTKEHGSGVGLAVAKKIVTGHHGMIEVTSAPDEGAVIVVRLPMVARAAEDRADEEDPHRRG